jgi:hypothetical protein
MGCNTARRWLVKGKVDIPNGGIGMEIPTIQFVRGLKKVKI